MQVSLGLVAYSRGTAERGYLVNNGDLATCDIDREEESGRLTEVTTSHVKKNLSRIYKIRIYGIFMRKTIVLI